MNSCMDEATNQGYNYVGIGGPHRKGETEGNDETRRCLAFHDLESAQMKGTSNKCDNLLLLNNKHICSSSFE